MEAVIANYSRPWRRAFAANQNQTAFVAKASRLTPPNTDGTIAVGVEGVRVPAAVKVVPVGVGSANDAYSLRMWGWGKVVGGGDHPNGGTSANVWFPTLLAELSCTLGAKTGIAGGIVPVAELFADTITIVSGGEGTITGDVTRIGNIVLYSPVQDLFAFAIVPLPGFDYIEFDSDQTTNTPTVNVLYSLL